MFFVALLNIGIATPPLIPVGSNHVQNAIGWSQKRAVHPHIAEKRSLRVLKAIGKVHAIN
jgi:hypothetical protein